MVVVPVEQAPPVLLISLPRAPGQRRWGPAHAGHAHVVGPVVAKGEAHGEAGALHPPEVRAEAGGLPLPGGGSAFSPAWRCRNPALGDAAGAGAAPAPEEGKVTAAEVEAHGALEALPWRRRRQQVDVGPLDGAGRLPHLALPEDRPRLRAEGHAAAAAALEVDDRQAQVVRVGQDVHLHVHAAVPPAGEEVRAEAAAAVGNLVGMFYVRDLVAVEGRAEGGSLPVEELAPGLPARRAGGGDRRRGGVLVKRQEAASDIQLHAEEGAVSDDVPRPGMQAVQRHEQAAGGVDAA
mmetsp:Transcript_77142/g.238928  ORF Transcript_77142/g.238928 Transcript_77142/m.238928 type:complete len:293 (-) Transcript_77142:44-922(-)